MITKWSKNSYNFNKNCHFAGGALPEVHRSIPNPYFMPKVKLNNVSCQGKTLQHKGASWS